ncbi:MAG: hypothetical protein PHX80_03645 [Candidatus Nanoarchaeia archaeon]|nr:hypothetical protein [Candidatus Nanoarchaeia archaeon]
MKNNQTNDPLVAVHWLNKMVKDANGKIGKLEGISTAFPCIFGLKETSDNCIMSDYFQGTWPIELVKE